MKKRKSIRRRNKPVFDALVWKWNSNQSWVAGAKRRKNAIASGVLSTLGAAAFLGITAASGVQGAEPMKFPEMEVQGREDSYRTEAPSSLKYTEPLRNVPQTFTVVPETVFKEQGATSLRDVLRGVAGITFAAGEGGTPPGDNLTIRGFSARTDLFIDGVRDFGGYSRDPFNLEQVEVIKGPASNYSGRGSTGGSVNLVSKTPHTEWAYSASIGMGTDDYRRTTVDFNQPISEGVSLRFNALYHDADTPGRDIATNERYGFAPSLAVGLGTPTRVILSYFHLSQDNIPDYGLPWTRSTNTNAILNSLPQQAPPVDFSTFFGIANRDYEETNTDIVTLEVVHDIDESTTLRNLLRYGRTDRDHLVVPPRFVDNLPGPGAIYDTTIKRETRGRDSQNIILTNQTNLTFELKTGEIEHDFVSGVEYTYETYHNSNRPNVPDSDGPNTDLFDVNPFDVPLSVRGLAENGPQDETESTTIAVYLFDTAKIGEKWQVSAGVRFESLDIDFTCERIKGTEQRSASRCNGALPSGIEKLNSKDEMLSWRAGLVYEVAENGSVYAAVGTSFNPSSEQLRLSSRVNSTTQSRNPNVEPEETTSFEIGTKWDLFNEKMALTVALFQTDKNDARTNDPTDPNDISVLEGKQRVEGLELGVAGSITDEWKVFSGYTYMESEVRASKNPEQLGNELARTPRHTLSLWSTYQMPWDIDLGAGAQFVDEQLSSDRNSRKSVAPSYWLFDAMASYIVNEGLTLRLNVFNLGDKDYISQLGGGHAVPGPGRSAFLTADMTF